MPSVENDSPPPMKFDGAGNLVPIDGPEDLPSEGDRQALEELRLRVEELKAEVTARQDHVEELQEELAAVKPMDPYSRAKRLVEGVLSQPTDDQHALMAATVLSNLAIADALRNLKPLS